jgi:ribosome-binding factor A
VKKPGQGRPQKLGDVIQRELSDLLHRELRDPRVGMVTITSVDVSPDLSHAKIFFTLLGKETLEETTRGLQLRFAYDESVERGDRLSRLIDSVKSKK